jgi:hypothetical protein
MNQHGRKYGEKESYPVPVWNGIFDHYERMGDALWTFMWLIDRIPKNGEREGVGRVLGGKPVKIADIVDSMRGSTYKAIRLQFDGLEAKGYISRRRTPYGYVIEVQNSRKWNVWTTKQTEQKGLTPSVETSLKGQSVGPRLPIQGAEIAPTGRNKENAAVHSSKATQQPPPASESPFWKEAGVRPERLPRQFVKLCEDLYATKNGQPLGKFMGSCMDAWKAMGEKSYPPDFARAKGQIAARERDRGTAPPIRPLPEKRFQQRNWTMEDLCPAKG